MQDRYKRAEDEFFRLRGQFDTGRLTQEQFDAALRELMIQDEQGRYWMIGADSGRWYFYDGTKWVQAEPYSVAAAPPTPETIKPISPPPAQISTDVSPTRLYAPPTSPREPPAPPARRLPFVPILIGFVVIALVAVLLVILFANRNRIPFLAVSTPRVITPILPPTITPRPSPTAIAVIPTSELPTLAPFIPTATLPPLPTEPPTAALLPTETISLATVVPIETPVPPTTIPSSPTLSPTGTEVSPGTDVSPTRLYTPTRPPTSALPTHTRLPDVPPGVYVTKIVYAPSAPKRNQEITFTATFLNTTGETKGFDWLILIFDPNKPGPNKGFGESLHEFINVPPGSSQHAVTYQGVRGPGGCISLYAQAAWQDAEKNRTFFQDGQGNIVQVGFDVCPAE